MSKSKPTRPRAKRESRDTPELAITDRSGDLMMRVPETTASAVRYFLARIERGNGGIPSKFGISSALRGEGVTFVSRAVGAVLANDFRRNVCVVELTWHDASREASRPGLADLLRKEDDLHNALVTTGDDCLSLLPAGSAPVSQHPLLTRSPQLPTVMDELTASFEHVILDLPPVLATSDAVLLGSMADGIALVARHGVTTERQLKNAIDVVKPIPLLGIILNRTVSKVPRRLRRMLSNW